MTLKTVQLTLPAYWADALINGDMTGYDDDELLDIESFQHCMLREYAACNCLDADTENVEFTHSHHIDARGIKASDCCTFTFEDCRLTDDQVKQTIIGEINEGIDGGDLYVKLSMDDTCTEHQAYVWLLERHYKQARYAGDSFCHYVKVLPANSDGDEWVGIVHIGLDV